MPGQESKLRSWLSDHALPSFAARAGLCAAHLLIGDQAVSKTPTREKQLRAAPDAVADWVVLVNGYERAAVAQAKAELLGADGLLSNGASENPVAALYNLDYTLGEDEAKRVWQKP